MKHRWFSWFVVAWTLWFLSAAGVVQAHEITPKASQPAAGQSLEKPPGEVVLVFTEELVLQGSDLQVLDASGKQVDTGGGGFDLNDAQHATLRVKLNSVPDGVYTVKWKVKLLDGDSTSGSYHFGVGSVQVPTESPAADELDALPFNESTKPGDPGSSSSPWLWAAGGLTLLMAAGAAVVLWRRQISHRA